MNWRRFFGRGQADADQAEELESYVDLTARDYIAQGMHPDAARQAARRKLGNMTRIREEVYHMNTSSLIDAAWHDARCAFRMVRRQPAFSFAAILTLAIGIGANSAMFSVVNGVLLKPLPYPDSDKLIAVWHSGVFEGQRTRTVNFTPHMFFSYRDQNRTFEHFGVWHSGSVGLTGKGEPDQVRAVWLTEDVLPALGAQPAIGRRFSVEDDSPGTSEAIILSYGYWQRRFGGDRNVIGGTVTVDGRPHQVIGVMPEDFQFLDVPHDVLLAERLRPTDMSQSFLYFGIARLRSWATMAQADADVARMLPASMQVIGMTPQMLERLKYQPALRPLKLEVVGDIGRVLWVLMGGIAIVLLTASANVASLLLVRAEARRTELSIRAALGAGWGRIARELIAESVTIGLIAGVLGLGLAYAGVRLLVAVAPSSLPRLSQIAIDPMVLLFTAGAAILASLSFGSIPVLRYARPRVLDALRGSRAVTQSREQHRISGMLVSAQVALAMILLIGSGLMIRTFQKLRSVDPGFRSPEAVQTLRISIPPSQVGDPELVSRMEKDILNHVSSIPGVSSAALTSALPMEVEPAYRQRSIVVVEGRSIEPGAVPPIRPIKLISPGAFQTFGIKLVAGRELSWTDFEQRREIAIISESMAREFWGSAQSALGKRLRESNGPWREVIGVAGNVYDDGAHRQPPAIIYLPAVPQKRFGQTYVVRSVAFALRSSRAGTASLTREIEQAVWAVSRDLAVARVQTLNVLYERSLASTSFTLAILAIAGMMTLALGLVGVYGVLEYAVVQRRREVGIRIALGAEKKEIRMIFVRRGLVLCCGGIVAGLIAAAVLSRWMSSLLFGVTGLDPITYAAGITLLILAASAASYFPARRAASVDPIETLRGE